MSATTTTGPSAAPVGRIQPRAMVGFMAMVFGMFMAILDIQIVSASISEIQAGLAASPDEASWVQTSYLIAEIVMIPLSGFLSRLLSTRVLFTVSALGFTVFSLACAMASSLGLMVVFRAAQGFIGGAMIPTVFAASFLLFPGAKRANAMVLIGLTATLAPTIGPTLGGWLTQSFSWHWLFLINVPIGALIALVVWNTVDIDQADPRLLARFDWWGLLFMALFLGSLEYVMEEGPRWDWLQDETVALFAAVCAIAGALFFWRALSRDEPIVDLRAFLDRNFAIGCVLSFTMGVGLYGSVYLIPLFLGRVRGYNSMQIGEVMFITGACMFVAAPIVGRLLARFDPRLPLTLGLLLFFLALYLTAGLTSQHGFAEMAFPLGLRGVAMMMCMAPINQMALGTIPPAGLKGASGLYNLMRNLGGAVGLAIINTLVTDRSYLHRLHLAEAVNWARPAVEAYRDTLSGALSGRLGGAADVAALGKIQALVNQQALVLAYNDTLLVMAGAFLASLPLVLLLRRPRPGGGGGEAH
ncbi:DHA2 family efflux MFS transporter permease subunit [Pseudoroseomonas cervicalis]|uniref:Drug resistance MFS transporter, drug:H+ antiporter-2 family n=1 Tax=Pseudoroseomonas cervicalis ATCC 49957 TaxID=525371 RepID=D5RLR4_9PROT|nr:DHA2 family efflux MFS transporter permease subunit [Pseudoroseomonas cervicalis]EFH11757.1 drug resistance MFS transporter, drug:H+ antiporter-2 family [Pseudoroseomonas cervicalis ATCC 49957]